MRTAALSALLALLQAPQLRTWPVPLEAAKLGGQVTQAVASDVTGSRGMSRASGSRLFSLSFANWNHAGFKMF